MRLSNLRKEIEEVDGFLITKLTNIRYLVGFTGSSGVLLVTQGEAIFFTDFRYKEQSKREIKEAETFIIKESLFKEVAKHPIFKSLKRIGFEEELKYSNYELLKKELKNKKLLPLKDKVENLRSIKDEREIKNIKTSAKIADSAFKSIRDLIPKSIIRPGVKEESIATELDYQLRKEGASRNSFETIVASGPNAALPHARAGKRKLAPGDTIIIDFGALYNGYASDMTRTLILGDNPKANEIYKIVLNAQLTAINNVKPGVQLKELDRIARDAITSSGYGEYFGHSLGHGVGLEIHEAPMVSANSEEVAQKGMVFTIEPGIYLPGKLGVRIEDMVLVTDTGAELITQSPK